MLTTAKDATSFSVTAAGKAARTYVLERQTTLGTDPWTVIDTVGPLAGDAAVMLIDHAPLPDAGLYRLRVTAP